MKHITQFGTRGFHTATVSLSAKQSHVLWKLNKFIETGEIKRYSDAQYEQKGLRKQKKNEQVRKSQPASQQKILLILRLKFDAVPLQTKSGEVIDLRTLKPSHLRMTSPELGKVFDALQQYKRITKRKPPNHVIMSLLGALPSLLKDSYFVTQDVLKLLEIDGNEDRAMELCRLAQEKGAVGMNAILEWILEKHNVKRAKRHMATRSKWNIPCTDHTHIIYYSGIADAYEWGQVPTELAEEMYQTVFEKKLPQRTEIYNAVLKILVKDFRNNQRRAWAFFDLYRLHRVTPDQQTFTIFLNGCKKGHIARAKDLVAHQTLRQNDRTTGLYETQAQMIQIAETVLLKLMELAKPPVPPTKEQVLENPEVLKQYRSDCYFFRVEMDRVFFSTFLSCFTSTAFATGASTTLGPHHEYLQRAMFYLQVWVPEVRALLQYAFDGGKLPVPEPKDDSRDAGLDASPITIRTIEAPKFTVSKTKVRQEKAFVPEDFLPEKVLQPFSVEELNPWVVFPPSPLSHNKSTATYSNKKKLLVDFARVPHATLRKEYERRLYAKTEGKEGKNHPQQNLAKDKYHINRFLLRSCTEILARLGCHTEYYRSVWYALHKWGGVAVDLDKVFENGFEAYPYSKIHILAPKAGGSDRFIQSNAGAPDTSADVSAEVIDINIVEEFIYRIEEQFPKTISASRFAVELLAAVLYGSPSSIQARSKTFDAIFSVINREMYEINDFHRKKLLELNMKRNLVDNTPKKSLPYSNVMTFAETIDVLVKCIFAWEGMKRPTGDLVKSLETVLDRIYGATWLQAPETHPNCYKAHEKLLYSTILLWQPKQLFNPLSKKVYVKSLEASVDFVAQTLKARTNLSSKEKKLYVLLQDLFKLDPKKPGVEEKLTKIQWKIYVLGADAGSVEASNEMQTKENDSTIENIEALEKKIDEVFEKANERIPEKSIDEETEKRVETVGQRAVE